MEALLEVYGTLARLSPAALDNLLQPLLAPSATAISLVNNKQVRHLTRMSATTVVVNMVVSCALAPATQAFSTQAQCAAVLCAAAPDNQATAIVEGFLVTVTAADKSDAHKYMALLALGEIGRRRYGCGAVRTTGGNSNCSNQAQTHPLVCLPAAT